MSLTPLKVFVIAGESSGDQMAAQIIQQLREEYAIELQGVGGRSLENEGLQSLFPMEELSVMGILEIVPHIFSLLKRIKQTTQAIIDFKPDVVLSFDSPDFCFRVLKKYKNYTQNNGEEPKAKLIHFVAPTVWAWRSGRAKKIARFLDHLFCLFPFEPPYFTKVGLSASYMKHPFIDKYKKSRLFDWKRKKELNKKTKLIGVFPGSRSSEITTMLPFLWGAVKDIYKKYPDSHFVFLTLPHLEKMIFETVGKSGIPLTITTDGDNKESILSSCDFAMATSGTIGFELSLAKVPHIIAYKMNSLTAFIIRRLVYTRYIHLLNIHLKKRVVPELIQEQCTSGVLAREMNELIQSDKKQQRQQEAFAQLSSLLLEDKNQISVKDVIKRLLT